MLPTIAAIQAVAILVHLGRAKAAAVLLGPEGVGILGVVDQLVQLVAHLSGFGYPLTHFVSRYVVLTGFGEAEAGLLQGAFDLSGALALVLGPSTALSLAPVVNRRMPLAQKAQAALDFLRDLTLVGAGLAMPLVLFPRLGLTLLFTPDFARVSSAVFLLVVAQCLRLLAGVFQTLLIGLDDIKVYGALVAAGQLSFGALSWLWGRAHGVHGVALAYLLSNLALLLLAVARASLKHRVSLPWRLRGLLAYALLALLVAGALGNAWDDGQAWAVVARLGACALFVLHGLLGPRRTAARLQDGRGAGGAMRTALRLNLGSGNEPLPGYVNVDRRRVPGVQIVAEVERLPFRDGSVAEIRASSLLEHFADPYSVLDEVHRVLAGEGRFLMRVPALWSFSAVLDRSHVFLADLKLWREILAGYFGRVRASPEGVRYRDNKLLVALCHAAVYGLRMLEFAQTWRSACAGKRPRPIRAYIPWWLEEKYAPGARRQEK